MGAFITDTSNSMQALAFLLLSARIYWLAIQLLK